MVLAINRTCGIFHLAADALKVALIFVKVLLFIKIKFVYGRTYKQYFFFPGTQVQFITQLLKSTCFIFPINATVVATVPSIDFLSAVEGIFNDCSV